jgi:hypothetical protein
VSKRLVLGKQLTDAVAAGRIERGRALRSTKQLHFGLKPQAWGEGPWIFLGATARQARSTLKILEDRAFRKRREEYAKLRVLEGGKPARLWWLS